MDGLTPALWLTLVTLNLPLMTDGVAVGDTKVVDEPDVAHAICEGEIFQADCQAGNKIIQIILAEFGRMTESRCIRQWDKGELGCRTDVMSVVDRLCSGKSTCQIRMPHDNMVSLSTCPLLLRTYLNVMYTCEPVMTVNSQDCYLPLSVHIDREVTTISSSLMIDRGCEVINLQADPGQTLQLSIVDFLADKGNNGGCALKYGELIEIDNDGKEHVTDICQGNQRQKQLYSSTVHELQLLLERDAHLNGANFLLKAEALGCQDITPPQGTWLRREGDKMVIGCHGNQQQTWHLTCENQRWVGGAGNCSEPVVTTTVIPKKDGNGNANFEITERFWIFCIACVAFIGCVTIITIGIVWMRKMKIKERALTVEHQQMQTLRYCPNTNTVRSDPTYAVYDRIPGMEESFQDKHVPLVPVDPFA